MTELTEHHRKVLTEYLGERFMSGLVGHPYLFNGTTTSNRPFTTPADLHAVYSKMVEKGRWLDFLAFASTSACQLPEKVSFTAWLSCYGCPDQIAERMEMAAEWIEKLKGA